MSYAEKYAAARQAIEAANAGPGRKLGSVQASVLRSLIVHGNFPGGWIYGNRSTTVNALESLAKRGLVARTERTESWGYRNMHTRTVVSYTPAAALLALTDKAAV